MSQATTRRTRAKNATTHPGQIVLDAQQKRRTKEVKEADDRRLQAAQEAREAAALAGLNQLAAMQVDMEEAQAQEMVKKPTAVRPRARPKRKVQSQGPTGTNEPDEPSPDKVGACNATGRAVALKSLQDGDSFDTQLLNDGEFLDNGAKKKVLKNAPRPTLKAAIADVQSKFESGGQARACHKKGNSLPQPV